MITINELEKNGYRKFIDSFKEKYNYDGHSPYKGTWQKAISDDKGKKYFINIEYWHTINLLKEVKNSFLSYSHMEDNNEKSFNTELMTNKSLKEIEVFFENQWKNNNCKYYELY